MWQQVKQALADSTAHFLTKFASLLPGLVALILALLVSLLLAWILATIVRRLLTSLHFDERLGRWGFAPLAEWSPLNSPTLLVSRSLAALVIVSGFLIGIAAFDLEWTYLFVQSILAYIPIHAIRRIDLKTGIITTVLGTGEMGDGPEPDPLHAKLSRPHAVLFANGVLYVADSETHRIRVLH